MIWIACGRDQPQPIVLLLALYGSHACFSLFFLELWSLTQGSYSLQILSHIARGGDSGDLLSRSRAIGRDKFDSRLASLEKLGLIRSVPDRRVALSGTGKIVSSLTALIASVAVTDLRE
jgi:DNA-binding HxlR family transcriptional regulator